MSVAAEILPWIGVATGSLALFGVAVIWGTYKERIDNHERWFRLLIEQGVMAAQRQRKIRSESALVPTPSFIAAMDPELKKVCDDVAAASGPRDDCVKLGHRLLKKMDRGMVLDDPHNLVDADGRILADFATLLLYIRQQVLLAHAK